MSKVVIGIVVILILAVAVYMITKPGGYMMPQPQNQQSDVVQTPDTTPDPSLGTEVPLNTQNDSNELGVASLKEVGGKVVVTVNVKGEPAEASQPSHIHTGACPAPGGIKYPLNPVVNGTSETTLDVSMADLKGMLPLAINLHESATAMTNYVACGDIKL